jgi:CheY-like chemotaxis protein
MVSDHIFCREIGRENGMREFTAEELEGLKEICEISEKYGVKWALAVSAFPAETEHEKTWKERTLEGIRQVEAIRSKQTQRVLVVEDEDAIRKLLELFLKKEGYLVDVKRDLAAAMEAVDANEYDIMLVDKNMPGVGGNLEGGIDFLKYLHSRSTSSSVIMMTGNPTVESAEEAFSLGALDYIHKPFSLIELAQKIKKLSK